MLGTDRDAADGSQLTACSLLLSDSGPLAVSRKPMADPNGQVYEQFLGKVIRLTAGHQAKVEEKPEARKASGVYHTRRNRRVAGVCLTTSLVRCKIPTPEQDEVRSLGGLGVWAESLKRGGPTRR